MRHATPATTPATSRFVSVTATVKPVGLRAILPIAFARSPKNFLRADSASTGYPQRSMRMH
jgi:hypothetical protein